MHALKGFCKHICNVLIRMTIYIIAEHARYAIGFLVIVYIGLE